MKNYYEYEDNFSIYEVTFYLEHTPDVMFERKKPDGSIPVTLNDVWEETTLFYAAKNENDLKKRIYKDKYTPSEQPFPQGRFLICEIQIEGLDDELARI